MTDDIITHDEVLSQGGVTKASALRLCGKWAAHACPHIDIASAEDAPKETCGVTCCAATASGLLWMAYVDGLRRRAGPGQVVQVGEPTVANLMRLLGGQAVDT
jgi:hypothetical protein